MNSDFDTTMIFRMTAEKKVKIYCTHMLSTFTNFKMIAKHFDCGQPTRTVVHTKFKTFRIQAAL